MTVFYLIRHGETDWNVTGRWQGHADIPLNGMGRAQAQLLAERFKGEHTHFDAIYTSDLQRAAATAQPIGAALGVPVLPLRALREIDLGWWSGLTIPEIRQRDPEIMERIFAGEDLPRGGAERRADLLVRVMDAVAHIAAEYADQTVALVTHGGVIQAFLRHIGSPLRLKPENIGNTSISIVTRTTHGWTFGPLNDIAHLAHTPEEPPADMPSNEADVVA